MFSPLVDAYQLSGGEWYYAVTTFVFRVETTSFVLMGTKGTIATDVNFISKFKSIAA
ncbi:hypothetical protein RB2150_00235 [Rhodobacterales bacterium HTCC2150]|nr:hypothetical protein RB2150_00235 [Rhodobacterales bacterium HTCC2150] [Rhodobacteraceae bacterium HTCC2150]